MSAALYLIAHVAGRAVAVRADDVVSVVDLDVVTPVPCSLPGVVGLAALRSKVVTVIDPCIALAGTPTAHGSRRAVVARIEGHSYAFLVSAIEDVAAFAPQPLPAGLTLQGAWAGRGQALIERDGEPLLVIALDRLLPSGEARAAA